MDAADPTVSGGLSFTLASIARRHGVARRCSGRSAPAPWRRRCPRSSLASAPRHGGRCARTPVGRGHGGTGGDRCPPPAVLVCHVYGTDPALVRRLAVRLPLRADGHRTGAPSPCGRRSRPRTPRGTPSPEDARPVGELGCRQCCTCRGRLRPPTPPRGWARVPWTTGERFPVVHGAHPDPGRTAVTRGRRGWACSPLAMGMHAIQPLPERPGLAGLPLPRVPGPPAVLAGACPLWRSPSGQPDAPAAFRSAPPVGHRDSTRRPTTHPFRTVGAGRLG